MRLALAFAALLAGCSVDLGACDMSVATHVVYDEAGLPAYEGQSQLAVSCGNGSFCHSRAARGDDRFGAPAGLDFDVQLASADASAGDLERLAAAISEVRDHRESIYLEVRTGRMPPFGEATLVAHAGVPRFADAEGTRVPFVDSFEGLAVLRNWLACGAPVVERTEGSGTVGDVVPPLDTGALEPRFTSIYERVLSPLCGESCHSPEAPDFLAEHQLDLSTPRVAYDALVDVGAMGSACDAGTRVVPGDPAASLLLQKLAGTHDCGDPMPLGGTPIPSDTLDVVAAWITAGAADD